MKDQSYLEKLIADKIGESVHLEYKAAAALGKTEAQTTEISKDISAFANADGGVIIYGISEGSPKHLPGKIDPVDRLLISQEWLDQIIVSKIRPRIDDFVIVPITIDNDDSQVVYVVEIAKSSTAHQAEDKRYYRRNNTTRAPMFDYEVRDIMNRPKDPLIQLEFEIVKKRIPAPTVGASTNPNDQFNTTNASITPDTIEYWLHVYARNNGKVYARYINAEMTLPQRCLFNNQYDRSAQSITLSLDNMTRDLIKPIDEPRLRLLTHTPPYSQYGPGRFQPVLPTRRCELDKFRLSDYATDYENTITWTVYADNAEPQGGEKRLQHISNESPY